MIPTVEARWFFRGPIPDMVAAWFNGGDGSPVQQPTRTDYYLRLPQNDALGVKWREGQIEAKRRDQHFGVARFGPQATGAVELWRKWSFSLATDSAFEKVEASDEWIGVRKVRWLRGYRLQDGAATAVSPDDPSSACHLELTELTANEEIWWTVGLESYGAEEVYRARLLPVASTILAPEATPDLPATASFAYPRWLLQLLGPSSPT